MERITYADVEQAVKIAAKSTGLPLTVQPHGYMGRGKGYSITVGENGSRLGPIAPMRQLYDFAQVLIDASWEIKKAAANA